MDQKTNKAKINEAKEREYQGSQKKKMEIIKDDKKDQSFSEWLMNYFSSSL